MINDELRKQSGRERVSIAGCLLAWRPRWKAKGKRFESPEEEEEEVAVYLSGSIRMYQEDACT